MHVTCDRKNLHMRYADQLTVRYIQEPLCIPSCLRHAHITVYASSTGTDSSEEERSELEEPCDEAI